MSKFPSEAVLQALVVEAIHSERLSEIVIDDAGLMDRVDETAENVLPHFSIDRLSRSAAVSAGARVLKALDSLTILSADENVSLTASETLRPDIVCYSPELESVVIFELKNSSQPGRQAISEFAAYEQEVKNHLPLLAERDICLVLISTEWSTLMDHGVSAAVTWANKNILCLQACNENEQLVLRTRVPQAWHITGSVFLNADALATVTLSLYDKDEFQKPSCAVRPDECNEEHSNDSDEIEEIPRQLLTAVDIIAREGDLAGSHGFVLLWRDHAGYSEAAYSLTLCTVSPFAIYGNSHVKGKPNSSALMIALDEILRDSSPSGHSETLFSIGRSAFRLLSEVSDPKWEGLSTWDDDKVSLSLRAEPIICEFWGALGRYARDYVLSPAVRTLRPNFLLDRKSDWRDPNVAIPLITQFSQPLLFNSGAVRWSDAFQLGVYSGLDRLLRINLRQAPDIRSAAPLQCRFIWNRMDFMLAIDEMRLLADSADNVDPPAKPLEFYADPLVDDEEPFDRYVEWTCEKFLGGEVGHVNAFLCGLEGAALFDSDALDSLMDPDLRNGMLARIDTRIRSTTSLVLEHLYSLQDEGSLLPEARRALKRLASSLRLKGRADIPKIDKMETEELLLNWRSCLDASDWIVFAVLHRKPALPIINVDWEWLRQGVIEAFKRGDTNVGVILSANGMLGTGPISAGGMRIPMSITDPAVEVMFANESSVMSAIVKLTWAELMAMTVFPGH